jgi:hypothetical protein
VGRRSAEQRQDAVRKVWFFVNHEARLKAISHHAKVLAAVRKLMGDREPEMFQDMCLVKPPRLGREKPWHQDHAYFDYPLGTPVVGTWIALDAATIEIITALGGLHAIAISHPHYYASMVEWSRAFGQVPIYLHAADRAHVMRPDAAMHFWEGRRHALLPGVQLVQLGGHFAGGTVLQWDAGAEGRGALLTGDIIQVIPDRRYVSFMRSYPNFIPLPPQEVERMAHVADSLRFDRIYGAWWDAHITHDAHAIVQRSAARYATWCRGMPTP